MRQVARNGPGGTTDSRSRPRPRVALAGCAVGLLLATCSGRSGTVAAPPQPTFTLLALADVRGQIEPCGCTTDPLGDIARTVKVIRDARATGPTLVVDAGSLLYAETPVPPYRVETDDLKADLLAQLYRDVGVDAVGLGPLDLARGPERVRLPRMAENMTDASVALAPARVFEAGAKIGVFGLVAPASVAPLRASDPIVAGQAAIAKLRSSGAQLVIALVNAPSKADALAIVRGVGDIDIAVLGLDSAALEPKDVPAITEFAGRTAIVMPANRGQVVSRLAVTMRGAGPLTDAIGPSAAAARIAALDAAIKAFDAELAAYAQDPNADAKFVAAQVEQRRVAQQARASLAQQPFAVPANGNYFVLEQLAINKARPCDAATVAQKQAFDVSAGAANARAAAKQPAIPIPAGAPVYAGTSACQGCHAPAVAFWETTRHAQAWDTLEKVGKQMDFECVSCHATGWEQPGGSTMANNATLRDVQCETCHGPGSRHVASATRTDIVLTPPTTLCAQACHTPQHSDTFDQTAYLRDIVGPGHGEARRQLLGVGPTGRELRQAGLAKASASLGADCPK